MSTATRPRGRHAGLTFRDWKSIAQRLQHEKKADTAYVRRVEKDLRRTRQQLGTAVVESMEKDQRIAELEDALRVAEEANETNRRKTSIRPWVRDTSDPLDQATVPNDVRDLQVALDDNYLNNTGTAWRPRGQVCDFKVKSLHEAFVMDRPPVTPTDLPGETTLTLRVTAA